METPEAEKLKKNEYQGDASSRMDLKDDLTAKENGKLVELQSNPVDHHNISRELAGSFRLTADRDHEKGPTGSMRSIKSNMKNQLAAHGHGDKSHAESHFGKQSAAAQSLAGGSHAHKESKSKLTVQSRDLSYHSPESGAYGQSIRIECPLEKDEHEQKHLRVACRGCGGQG